MGLRSRGRGKPREAEAHTLSSRDHPAPDTRSSDTGCLVSPSSTSRVVGCARSRPTSYYTVTVPDNSRMFIPGQEKIKLDVSV